MNLVWYHKKIGIPFPKEYNRAQASLVITHADP